MTPSLNEITSQVTQLERAQGRCIVAIAGPPGSGKSTLAEQLNKSITAQGVASCVMPMDGFHLDNTILVERGHAQRKGAPHTFDANGFVDTVARIHAGKHTVYVPVFDRQRDIAVAGVQSITPEHRIILIEGNYLLLRETPWVQLANYFSLQIFLNPGMEVIEQRILERWRGADLDKETIIRRTYQNDLPNAKYVLEESNIRNTIEISHWS